MTQWETPEPSDFFLNRRRSANSIFPQIAQTQEVVQHVAGTSQPKLRSHALLRVLQFPGEASVRMAVAMHAAMLGKADQERQ